VKHLGAGRWVIVIIADAIVVFSAVVFGGEIVVFAAFDAGPG
jgi:hypothetical protein